MFLLSCRFGYYCRGVTLVDDGTYDGFEAVICRFEGRHPEMRHPHSPTRTVGGDIEEHYPASVRRWFDSCGDETPTVDVAAWYQRFEELETL